MGVLIIQDGGGDPPAEQTSTVLYKFSAEDHLAFPIGSEHLVHAPFALDPSKPKPVMYHPVTGERADIIEAAWDKYGQADMHQLVCMHTVADSGTSIEFTTDPQVPKIEDSTPQFNAADMGDYTIHIPTTSGVEFTARLGDAIMRRVWRTGKWVDEREWFIRSTGPEGEKGPGVRWFVDRRADETIWLELFIENTVHTLTTESLRGTDPDATGEVFYSRIYHTGVPANHFVRMTEMEMPSADTPAGDIVRPENVMGGIGPEQLIPNGKAYAWSYVFRSSLSNTAKADSIGQYVGYGAPVAGTHTVYSAKGYSGNSGYGHDFSDPRINHEGHGAIGIDSTIARDRNWLATLKARILAGSAHGGSGNFVQERQGMYYPYGPRNIRDAGGEGIDLRGLGSLHGEGFRIAHLRYLFTLQRSAAGLTDPATGDQITQEDLVAANGGVTPLWNLSFRSQMGSESWNHTLPCFARPGYTQQARFGSTSNTLAARAHAMELRPHNRPQTLATDDPDSLPDSMNDRRVGEKRNNGSANHNEEDGDHESRVYGAWDPLAYGANRGFAKYLIVSKGVATQRFISRFGINTSADAQAMNGEYYRELGSMQFSIDVIVANGKTGNAGWGRVALNRGYGMHDYCVANGFRFSLPDSQARTNALLWVDKMAELGVVASTPYGVGMRNSAWSPSGALNFLANGSLASGFALQQYPASDFAMGATDMVGRTGAIPLDQSVYSLPGQYGIVSDPGYHCALTQTFQPGYKHMGGTATMLSMVRPETVTWDLLRVGVEFALSMYRHARVAGELVPPSMVMISEGPGGDLDAPGTGQGPWAGGALRPGAWKFDQQNFTDPTNGIDFWFNPEWDHRQLVLMANCLQVCAEEGNQAELDELVQYVKDYAGVPAGTVDDAINAFYGIGGTRGEAYNGESGAQPYQSEYKRVQFGAIIGTLRGLQDAGLLDGSGGGGGGTGTPPLAPTLVSATPVVGGLDLEVTLASGGEPAAAFIVQAHVAGQPFTQALYAAISTLDQSGAPTYTLAVRGLDAEAQTVHVLARNGSGANSPASNELTETPDSDGGTGTGLAAPTNFVATAAGGSADVTFDAVDGAAVYYVGVGTESGVYTRWEYAGTNTSKTIWSLDDGTEYFMVVEARNSSGDRGPISDEAWVIPPDQQGLGGGNDPVAPDPPANIAATPGDGEVSVTWN